MEEGMRSSPELDDIPELIHRIQFLLPVKEAARTSVLSKSWLHAWSTSPTLRFRQAIWSVSKEQRGELLKVVDHTLIRYLRDNIPIQSIDIKINIENQESISFAEQWIRPMATKSCIQELSLEFCLRRTSFALPEEILSGKNLSKIRVHRYRSLDQTVWMARHPVINCLYLRELDLMCVHISEDVLHDILSTCSFLEKINLNECRGFETIKIKNLHCLYELEIGACHMGNMSTLRLEINDVPNIRLLSFEAKPISFNLDSLVSVTQLSLGGVIVDDAFVDIIELKFPFLESLTLDVDSWKLESFNFTCASIKRISIKLVQLMLVQLMPVNIKVYAPNLVSFHFNGMTMPSILFPATILEEMDLSLFLMTPLIIDESFFLKMREALTFSRKCDCDITIDTSEFDDIMPSDINVDELRRRVPFPAINVQQLSFKTFTKYKGFRKGSSFFDALFSICHPKHVVAFGDSSYKHNYFSQLMVKKVIGKNTRKGYWGDHFKDVEIRLHGGLKWETLTDSWRGVIDGWDEVVEFRLNWR